MNSPLTLNASATPLMTFPPLPPLPPSAIFDSTYTKKIMAIFNDSSFPPMTPPSVLYSTRLQVIEAVLESRRKAAQNLSVNLLAAWTSMVLLCGVLLVRIRRNRQRALLGDVDAAQKIILPAFEPLLWIVGIANFMFLVMYTVFRLSGEADHHYNRITVELAFNVKLINGLLVITYMFQPSLSRRSLFRAILQAIVLSTYTLPVVVVLNAVATPDNQRACYWILMAARAFLTLFLLYVLVFPPGRASLRSFRLLALYIIGMAMLILIMSETYRYGYVHIAEGFGWGIAVYSTLLPLCVWNVLRADTEHWRGIGKRAVELQAIFRRNYGHMHERVSSQGLHVLIELHRKYIIDFARLEFDEPIANLCKRNGTKAIVYRGFLHSKKLSVAIKVYVPNDVTEEIVAEFSHEAALCGALVHPNILQFHGLCVCPPNICLVTEFCDRSLQDLIDARAAGLRRGCIVPLRRQQALIEIGYLIDAARAIAYLHSFTPSFVHRDIKPSNFLIDPEGTVKLTDFGASRVLSVRSVDTQEQVNRQAVLEMPSASKYTSLYMAPEVLKARNAGAYFYGEAADVFSLSILMWDVLHPDKDLLPLDTTTNNVTPALGDSGHWSAVVAGHRPPMNPHLHAGLRELIQVGWHPNSRMRPTAQSIVTSLEAIQEELAAPFALAFITELDVNLSEHTTVSGITIVETLRQGDFVETLGEGIRVGNLLMDGGFLHHIKHNQCFQYGTVEYVFDNDQILLGQPLAVLKADDETPETGTSSRGDSSSHSSRGWHTRRCACRQLRQRLATERTTRHRFLRKSKVSTDENWLTTSLLVDDGPFGLDTWTSDFAGFYESTESQRNASSMV